MRLGTCQHCGEQRNLTGEGRLRAHGTRPKGVRDLVKCPGSHLPPQEVEIQAVRRVRREISALKPVPGPGGKAFIDRASVIAILNAEQKRIRNGR